MIQPPQEPVADPYVRRRMIGLFLCLLVCFPLLALATYNWRAVPALVLPPLTPSPNLIGVAGDWFAYRGYVLLGLAIWIVPVLLLAEGFLLLFGRSFHPARRSLGVTAFVFSLACLLQLCSAVPAVQGALHAVNAEPNAGGAVGYLVMTRGLSRLLSPFGSGILMAVFLIASILTTIGPRALLQTLRRLGAWATGKDKTPEERAAERAARQREKEALRQAREEARAQRAAEREAAAREKEAEREKKRQEKEQFNAAREAAANEKKAAAERLRREREEALARKRETSAVRMPPAASGAGAYDPREVLRRAREAAMQAQADSAAAVRGGAAPAVETPAAAPKAVAAEASADKGPYKLPAATLLAPVPESHADHGDVDALARKLLDTLKLFDVEASLAYVVQGPVVTKFALTLAPGTKPDVVKNLGSTLQMTLKATSVRIQAPIPGEDAVGVELPNKRAASISFREIVESSVWRQNAAWPAQGRPKFALPLLLGKDSAGNDLVADLAQMPHLLVAGATGQGKSVCLNAIICGLLMSRTPKQLKFIMVDPKCVEFTAYAALPHLLVPVVTDNKKVMYSLRWAISEMDKRLKLFARAGKRNIADYNDRARVLQPELFGNDGQDEDMPAEVPYVVIVIDEVADLIASVGREVEPLIARLAAKARAAGIHLILATQRPDTKVITGTIKSNIPGRIAFRTSQAVDSRTILDAMGAEQLIGKGDMLFKTKDGFLVRAQGAWVSDDDIARITDFIAEHADVQFDDVFARKLAKVKEADVEDPFADIDDADNAPAAEGDSNVPPPPAAGGNPPPAGMTSAEDDALFRRALDVLRTTGRASTSHLQRKMGIGYNHAARVMDVLEERGIIGAARGGNNAREILVDLNAPEYLGGASSMNVPEGIDALAVPDAAPAADAALDVEFPLPPEDGASPLN